MFLSAENAADVAAKWKGSPDLSPNGRWYSGPSFVMYKKSNWAVSEFIERGNSSELLCHISVEKPLPLYSLIAAYPTFFSRWKKLHRCQMVIFKFLKKLIGAGKTCVEFRPFMEIPKVDAAEYILFYI